jgi:hypothetical protein
MDGAGHCDPTGPEAAALFTALTGEWRLDAAASDGVEPLMAFMGVPWLIRKMALAMQGNAVVQLTLSASTGAVVRQLTGRDITNSYGWGPGGKHVSPGGESAATLVYDAPGRAVVVVLQGPPGKGVMRAVYVSTDAGAGMVLTYELPDGVKIKRVFKRAPPPA